MKIRPTKPLIGLLVLGMSASAAAAPPPSGNPQAGDAPAGTAAAGAKTILSCKLKHSLPRGEHPPHPFSQHFAVDLHAKTVDGAPATVSADKIGWEPVQTYLRPYATLSLPGWQFHATRWVNGHQRDEISGSCKVLG